MENTRPYWKVIVSLTFSLIATILVIGIGWNLLRMFVPFVIGWVISFIANPMVCWLEKRLKIEKKLGSAIIIIAVLGAIVGLLYLGISQLVKEISGLIVNLPDLYVELESEMNQVANNLQGIYQLLPEQIRSGWSSIVANFETVLGDWIGELSTPTVTIAGNVAKSIPSILVGTIVTIVSAYFFIAEREEVIAWAKKVAPNALQDRVSMVISNMKMAVGGYFKAQFKIMLVVAGVVFVGLSVVRARYAIILAIVIAFLDFLPFFGTAVTLVPWAIYKFIGGDYKMAIVLLVIYGTTQLLRQVIQPKLVGDGVGLKPLPTLVFLYAGYRLGGVFWMIAAVPLGMIVINMYKAGAFDYILDDVKILTKGIMSLRK